MTRTSLHPLRASGHSAACLDRRCTRTLAAALLLTVGLACGGDRAPTEQGGSPPPTTPPTTPPPPPPTPGITLALARDTVSVVPGGRDSVAVTLTRTGAFAGEITLLRVGGPNNAPIEGGIDVVPVPERLTGAASPVTAWLRITADSLQSLGTYTMFVEGRGTGVTSQTVSLMVRVIAPPSLGTLTLQPRQLEVVQGQRSAPIAIALVRTAGVTGPVTLSVQQLPSTVTATFTPNPMPANTSTLVLDVGLNQPTGGIPVIVRATASGRTVVDTLSLLTRTFVPPDVGLLLDAPAISVPAGGSATLGLQIVRTGNFTAPVTMALEGAPAGLNASFDPSPAPGTRATLRLDAIASLPAGTYPMQVSVTGPGLEGGPRRVALSVAVTAPGSSRVRWAFCDASRVPRWFATRQGTASESWTRVLPVSNAFEFDAPANGQVALVRDSAGGTVLDVYTLSAGDLFQVAASECRDHPARVTVQGTIAAVNAAQGIGLAIGGADTMLGRGPTAFSLSRVGNTRTDLLAVRGSWDATTPLTFALRLIMRRDLTPVNGATLPVLDFDSSEWQQGGGAGITLLDTQGEAVGTEMALFTANGFAGTYLRELAAPRTSRTAWGPIPSALRASDLLRLTAFTAHATTPRRVVLYESRLDFFEVPFGPVLDAPNVVVTGTSPVTVQTTAPWPAAYGHDVTITLRQGAGAGARTVVLHSNRATLGRTSSTFALATPNFAGTSGWEPLWGLQTGQAVQWSTWLSGLERGVTAAPASGLIVRQAGRTGTITP